MDNVVTIDIEPTNRCNAKCHFCPRDMTPHQGLMSQETFDRTLANVIELRDGVGAKLQSNFKISLCGLGEPLINPRTIGFVRQIVDAGITCVMSSNGSILDERRGQGLLDAGLSQININVGAEGDEYEQVYQLPWEKTRDNIVRFAQMAEGRCQVNIVLVDYLRDRDHVKKMVKYWQGYGLRDFVFFDIMNRGGTLFVDHMQYESYPELAQARHIMATRGKPAVCGVPFISLFVGYDGQYYMCCSDWTKAAPMGSVFDRSFIDVTAQKLYHVTSREPICKSCNWDPLNRLTDALRAETAGQWTAEQREALVDEMVNTTSAVLSMIDRVEPGLGSMSLSELEARPDVTPWPSSRGKTVIPVSPA